MWLIIKAYIFFILLREKRAQEDPAGDNTGMIKGVFVPKLSYAGNRVNMTCLFDSKKVGLYSLKWYHNDTEFYRYVPTEKDRPSTLKPSLKFNVYEICRSDSEVTLELASLTSDANGEYQCEVIAEHPSFRTETESANMTVIEEPPLPPKIKGARESYDEHDIVHLQCVPQQRRSKDPKFTITWYIEGQPAKREFVRPFDESSLSPEGVEINALAGQIASSGGSAELECHLKLGQLDVKTSKSVKINVRKSNYFANYWSDGSDSRSDVLMITVSLMAILQQILNW